MTSADAIALARRFARNGGDTSVYPDTAVTAAINFVGTRFCRVTRYVKTVASISLTGASSAVNVSALTLWHPSQVLNAFITSQGRVQVVEYDDLLQMQEDAPETGKPEFLAFSTLTAGEVYPTPSANMTLQLQYWQQFNTTTYNLTDNVLYEILPTGAAAILQHTEPEQAYGSAAWGKYLEIERSYTSLGYGAQVARRNNPV